METDNKPQNTSDVVIFVGRYDKSLYNPEPSTTVEINSPSYGIPTEAIIDQALVEADIPPRSDEEIALAAGSMATRNALFGFLEKSDYEGLLKFIKKQPSLSEHQDVKLFTSDSMFSDEIEEIIAYNPATKKILETAKRKPLSKAESRAMRVIRTVCVYDILNSNYDDEQWESVASQMTEERFSAFSEAS